VATYLRVQARYVGRLGVEVGVFVAVIHLQRAGRQSADEEEVWVEIDDWFKAHLPYPPFYADGNTIRAVTWFRDPMPEDMSTRICRLRTILRRHAVDHDLVRSTEPGQIVYEERFQIGVIPRVRREQAPLPDGLAS
jgi:hypothetical protein